MATYFEADQDSLNARLVDVYKKGVEAIRKVDPDHIILIGAPQWNSNFGPLEGVDLVPR